MSRLHLPSVRAALLRELEVAVEQACDEAAARSVGDRVLVADAILAVERETAPWPLRVPGLVVISMSQLAIEERVKALLDEPRTAGRLQVVLAALLLAVWSGADSLHHVVESLLNPGRSARRCEAGRLLSHPLHNLTIVRAATRRPTFEVRMGDLASTRKGA